MRRYLGMCASVMLLSACSGNEPAAVGLSTRVGAAKSGAAVPGQTAQRLETSNGITVERIRLSVKELDLELEGDDDDDGLSGESGSSDTEAADDHDERETGPFIIDLSGQELEGKVVQLSNVQVEPGIYDEIEFGIEKVSIEDAGDDAGLKEMAQQEASVIIDGRIDGQPFSFVSSLTVEQEREARFEVKAEDGQNVTINIDPSTWFTGPDGQRLDPREDESRSAIEESIKKSIDAFDDDDHDGGEDHDDEDDEGSED
ncbi:hypothetical protein [Myxococcus sp. RHSTA-1-4]|uniref:hypothetical protein n=1 Tax=Myxococcus sp. RHSTA-1-4 TaxID=2874601 RepID=UPI001CBBEAB2|nr:hypothetical protein [Myxococcus sp. RHSTA-1-4]MBZ4421790.1 hypothetical protein [Myxococcus sp. RHSTA-1-4]